MDGELFWNIWDFPEEESMRNGTRGGQEIGGGFGAANRTAAIAGRGDEDGGDGGVAARPWRRG